MIQVSVIIPVFNRAATVSRAIDSALCQASGDVDVALDVVVVDDGSTDALEETLAKYGSRVRLVRHARNQGAAAARNSGVAAAEGDYVAFLDSDDVWLPEKIAAQLRAIRAERWKVSCTAYYLVRQRGREIVSPRYATSALRLADLVWGCFVSPGSTMMCERAVFEEVGPLDVRFRRLEDWDWLLRYAKRHDLGFLGRPLAQIESSPGSHLSGVLAGAKLLNEKHATTLSQLERRNFEAALEFVRAAAHLRAGEYLNGILELVRSMWLVPIGNVAMSAVLHNKMARGPRVETP